MFRTTIHHPVRAAAAAFVLGVCLILAACGERMNRDDFAQLIKGKTEQDVRKNAGKPDSVEERSDRHVWTYTSRTFDVQNQNKTDPKTIVIFTPAEGKWVVADVKYE